MNIVLNMIVRNEAHVIQRCLNSVKGIIDGAVIVDTGSSDDTIEKIKEWFYEHTIPFEIHVRKWVNFGHNRTQAWNLAKDKGDFIFTIDADEVLEIKNFDKAQLESCDVGIVDINFNGTIYTRRAFSRTSKKFGYFLPVHEVLICKEDAIEKKIDGLTVIVNKDGASWNQSMKDKYLAHAAMFLDYIKENGDEPRAVFYLAQSYRDAEENEDAIKWYQKRATITAGFFEERYVSQFWVAQLKWIQARGVSEVADEFLKCGELDDLRAEHLLHLKALYERNGRPNSAKQADLLLQQYAGKNPFPKRSLFINPAAYTAPPTRVVESNEPVEIDVVIVSKADTEELYDITKECVETLLASEDSRIKFNVMVVESGGVMRDYGNITTIFPDPQVSFGYHKFLNIGIKEGNAKYVVLCNNDLTFERGWASEILKAFDNDKNLHSASPFCPEVNEQSPYTVRYGHTIRKQVNGWCLFVKRSLLEKYPLDERFIFWYSDNDFAMTLKTNGESHALVSKSIVHHHGDNLGATGRVVLSRERNSYLTTGQEKIFNEKWPTTNKKIISEA